MPTTPLSEELAAFRDAVAADVAGQYPSVDYIYAVVSSAIERHAWRIGNDQAEARL